MYQTFSGHLVLQLLAHTCQIIEIYWVGPDIVLWCEIIFVQEEEEDTPEFVAEGMNEESHISHIEVSKHAQCYNIIDHVPLINVIN